MSPVTLYHLMRRTRSGSDKRYKTGLHRDAVENEARALTMRDYPRYLYYCQPEVTGGRTRSDMARYFRLYMTAYPP